MDFAWLLFMGMRFGYSEREVSHLYLGKWVELFQVYKKMHNMEMKRGIFDVKEKVSLLSI